MNAPVHNALSIRSAQDGSEYPMEATETAATASAAKAKALVEARYVMAKRFPRDMDIVREKLLKDCRRPSFALVARYEKPIGKDKSKWPRGPSIRFAESAVRAMTNVGVETTVVFDDRQKRIMHVSVTDYESSVPYEEDVVIQKTIERRNTKAGDEVIGQRKNSYGDDVYILVATDDEIINKQRAEVSKVIRTLSQRLLPGDIVDECMFTVIDTMNKADATDPDSAKRRLFDAFSELGVGVEQLKDYLGNDASDLSPKELVELRGLYAAIRDGESTWRDVMDYRDEQGPGGKVAGAGAGAPKELPTCTDDEFAKKSPGWRKQICENTKTEAELLAMVQTKYTLTEGQKKQISAWSQKQN